MESGMKTITSCVVVAVAAACAGCATHAPAISGTAPGTVPALPVAHAYSAAQLAELRKTPGGEYPGYQRILVDGQTRYCRKNLATDSATDRPVICLTEAQLWAEQLRAQELASAQAEDRRRDATQQLESQEAWRQQAQNIAVNNPVTVPMGMPATRP
jgi:hypothetical protein